MDDQNRPIQLDYARPPKRMSRAQLAAITAAAGACLVAGALALRPRAVQSTMTMGKMAPSQVTWQPSPPMPTTAAVEPP